ARPRSPRVRRVHGGARLVSAGAAVALAPLQRRRYKAPVHRTRRRGLTALAVLAFALVPLGAAEGGAFPGDNGLIAYTCGVLGTNICEVHADGSGKATLLTGATDPSWSADNTRIAYVDAVNGVSVATADWTGTPALGAGATSTQPTFSPDGQRVAYV